MKMLNGVIAACLATVVSASVASAASEHVSLQVGSKLNFVVDHHRFLVCRAGASSMTMQTQDSRVDVVFDLNIGDSIRVWSGPDNKYKLLTLSRIQDCVAYFDVEDIE